MRRSFWVLALTGTLAWCTGCGDDNAGPGDAGTDGPEPLYCGADIPSRVPFTITRPDVGDPLTAAEVADFTRKITGFWKDVGYILVTLVPEFESMFKIDKQEI